MYGYVQAGGSTKAATFISVAAVDGTCATSP